jgi:hypothetical protein
VLAREVAQLETVRRPAGVRFVADSLTPSFVRDDIIVPPPGEATWCVHGALEFLGVIPPTTDRIPVAKQINSP